MATMKDIFVKNGHNINKQVRLIKSDPSMSDDEKIDAIHEIIQSYAETAEDFFI
jgi:hypothetical protein